MKTSFETNPKAGAIILIVLIGCIIVVPNWEWKRNLIAPNEPVQSDPIPPPIIIDPPPPPRQVEPPQPPAPTPPRKVAPAPKPKPQIHTAFVGMADFMYQGHKATAKRLADAYMRDKTGASIIFSACDEIDPKIKKRDDGVYICDPDQAWTARVLMKARDSEGKWIITIDMTVLEVGEHQSNFRIDDISTFRSDDE